MSLRPTYGRREAGERGGGGGAWLEIGEEEKRIYKKTWSRRKKKKGRKRGMKISLGDFMYYIYIYV